MIGLTLLPTQQRGSLNLTKWTTQADEVDSTAALYLSLDHKEANTRIIISQLGASYFCQIKTILQFVHMECESVLPRVEEGRRKEWENISEEGLPPWFDVK